MTASLAGRGSSTSHLCMSMHYINCIPPGCSVVQAVRYSCSAISSSFMSHLTEIPFRRDSAEAKHGGKDRQVGKGDISA